MSETPPEKLLQRIRAEYLEMPGLRLKPDQMQRLCGVDRTLCQQVIDSLVQTGFLSLKPDGSYGCMTDGDLLRPHPAKADLKAKTSAKAS
jgi:hypothetical protein